MGADFNLTHGAVRKDPRRVCFGGQRILGVLEDFQRLPSRYVKKIRKAPIGMLVATRNIRKMQVCC